MERHGDCYTYFAIIGDFDPQRVSEILGLEPERTQKKGEILHGGRQSKISRWEIGWCRECEPHTATQMEKTIAPLLKKTDELNKVRKDLGAELYLCVVPTLLRDGVNPSLSPSLAVIDFCHETRTMIDIDLYVE